MPKDHSGDKQQWNDSKCSGTGRETVIRSQQAVNGNGIESEPPVLFCYRPNTAAQKKKKKTPYDKVY
jgi:hypothetical protein